MEKRRVVITGMGSSHPSARQPRSSWAAAKAGVCGIDTIQQYDTSKMKVKVAGEVKDFQAGGLSGAPGGPAYGPVHPVCHAGPPPRRWNRAALTWSRRDAARCGVAVSSGIGGMTTIQNRVPQGGGEGL